MTSGFFETHRLIGWLANIPPVLGALLVLLLLHPRIRQRMESYYPFIIAAGFIATRICLYVIIYLVIGYKGQYGDIQSTAGGWFQSGTSVLEGSILYRDFFSNYSALLSYLVALPYMVSKDPTSVVVLFIVFDLTCLILIRKIASNIWGSNAALDAAIIYTFTPLTWFMTVRYAQDEIILAFFALLAIYLWQHKSYNILAVVLGLGFCFTKFMFILVIVPFVLVSPSKIKFAAILGGIIVLVNLPFVLVGADVLSPLKNQSNSLHGIGVWQSCYGLFQQHVSKEILVKLSSAVLACVLAVSSYIIFRKKINPNDGTLVFLLMAIALSPKSYPLYILAYVPMLIVYLMQSRRLINFCVFSIVASVSMQIQPCAKEESVMECLCSGSITWQAIIVLVFSLYLTITQVYWAVDILRSRSQSTEYPEPVVETIKETSVA